jgi:uncharacterized protein YjeT (DUF2065 family)
MNHGNNADTGFRPYHPEMASSDIGPVILAIFAFLIFGQGLIYILKPDMTGRSLTVSKEKLRRLGFLIVLASGIVLYFAFSWWVETLTALPPVDRPNK